MSLQIEEQIERQRNRYGSNCSGCKQYVEAYQGFLFKNTKFRNSRGYHTKCNDCYTGETAKRLREEAKCAKGKTLSLAFAKKWCDSLEIKFIKSEWEDYCEVYDKEMLILGYSDFLGGDQEYPNEEWCEAQGKRLNGTFTDKAVNHICDGLTQVILEYLEKNGYREGRKANFLSDLPR